MNNEDKILSLLEKQSIVLESLQKGQERLENRQIALENRQIAFENKQTVFENKQIAFENKQSTLEGKIDNLQDGQAQIEYQMGILQINQEKFDRGQTKLIKDVGTLKKETKDLYLHIKYIFQDIDMLDNRTKLLLKAK